MGNIFTNKHDLTCKKVDPVKRFTLASLGLVLLVVLLLAGITLIIQIRERAADNENSKV